MRAHTPGPWVVKLDHRGYVANVGTAGSDDVPGAVGSTLFRLASFRIPSSPETHANAALIASAPDLLDALRALTAFAATHTGEGATPEEGRLLDGYGEGVAHAVAAGRAAIARAEGRAP